jgi:uncharacterized protein YxjI
VSTAAQDPAAIVEALESSNRFLIQQVFRPIGNEYRISIPAPGTSEEGEPLLFVKQKKLSIREDIRFRLDPDSDAYLFMIKAKTVFEFRGRHDVLDADGAQIGLLEKDFARSLVRSHWHVRDSAGAEFFEGYEASWPIAIVRRIAGFLPEIFAALTWLPFNFVLMRDGQQVGSYKRVLGKLRDRYVLELDGPLANVDRRLVLAFAIGLDALQDR